MAGYTVSPEKQRGGVVKAVLMFGNRDEEGRFLPKRCDGMVCPTKTVLRERVGLQHKVLTLGVRRLVEGLCATKNDV